MGYLRFFSLPTRLSSDLKRHRKDHQFYRLLRLQVHLSAITAWALLPARDAAPTVPMHDPHLRYNEVEIRSLHLFMSSFLQAGGYLHHD